MPARRSTTRRSTGGCCCASGSTRRTASRCRTSSTPAPATWTRSTARARRRSTMRGRPPPERFALKTGMAGRGEQAMASARPIDLGAIIEGQSRNGFVIKLILLSIAITFFDGFDMHVIAYTATYLTDDFGLSRVDMGNLFAAGVVGTMVGGFFFGYLGDRIGRRPAIVGAAAGFGVLTLAFSLA